MKLRSFAVILLLLGMSYCVQAQYWFGPKVGGNWSQFIYQEETYAQDSFKISPSYNFELGGIFIYQATKMFSVQGELYYERLSRTLNDRPFFGQNVNSTMTYNFLSAPMLFKVSFGREPVHYYVDGGIKLKFWLGGNGEITSGETEEFDDGPEIVNKIVFRQSKSNTVSGSFAAREANIMQFGLSVGGGIYLDLITNGRFIIDFKYTFGHSNMGFNNNPDFLNDVTGYNENFSFRTNTISVSLGYLFQYDVKLHTKGMSTSKASNEAHDKKKK
ncbi:MAG: PorT family protein [Cyclobacteriaceae bacterium]